MMRRQGLVWLLLALAACAGPERRRREPVSEQARASFAEARRLGSQPGAEAAAWRATRLADDWDAPWRWLDDRLMGVLRGPEALARHWSGLEDDPDDPMQLYLAGRLEGQAGLKRFERALRVAPDSSWAWHGRAFRADRNRNFGRAIEFGERALARARAPYEACLFASALARYLRRATRNQDAVDLLQEVLEHWDFESAERLELRVALTEAENEVDERALRESSQLRAFELLGHPDLSSAQLGRLLRLDGLTSEQEMLALGPNPSAPAAGVRWSRMLREGASPLALRWGSSLFEKAEAQVDPYTWLLASFAGGDVSEAMERWLAGLPRQVLDTEGRPRKPELARLMRAARALRGHGLDSAPLGLCQDFGAALLASGWFEQAQRFAQRAPGGDLEFGLELDRKARAGLDFVAEIRRLSDGLDGKPATSFALESGDGSTRGVFRLSPKQEPVDSLEALLDALLLPISRVAAILAEPGNWDGAPALEREFAQAPRVGFGWIGAVLHPGLRFSAQDQRLGRGPEGALVPGPAKEFARLGRMILAGDAIGVPLDMTMLRVVLVEEQQGEHLGRPWSGTIFWCDGAEVQGRAGRVGANLSGAALHEGYWIDLDVLRRELRRWDRVAQNFDALPEATLAALATPALSAQAPPGSGERGDAATVSPLLGQADRVRLAVLYDRGTPGKLGRLRLEELVETTATHEEAHLCDRAEFYPLGAHFWRVFGFAIKNGLSAERVQRRLEYRAQLVALASIPDPRIALVDLLDAAENGGSVTPHAAAYTRLLEDLLELLLNDIENQPERWPGLDPSRRLALQTHRLGPEALRALAQRLAAREGLTARDFLLAK